MLNKQKEYSTDYQGIEIIKCWFGEIGEIAYYLDSHSGDQIELDHWPTTEEIKGFAAEQFNLYS